MKTCSKCKLLKSFNDFRRLRVRDGWQRQCKKCHNARGYKHAKANPEKRRKTAYIWLLKTKYGLTFEEYQRLLADQGFRCALCRSSEHKARNWIVDHDHRTGAVRGILCGPCNLALGHYEKQLRQIEAVRLENYLTSTTLGRQNIKVNHEA